MNDTDATFSAIWCAASCDAPRRPITRPVVRNSIDSTPYATIFVDGKRLDVTPISRRSLRAGHHRVRAVLADGRHKDFAIDVPSGGQTEPIHLTW